MPSSLSVALASHLSGELTTLATLWAITRRDGVEFFFTDHDMPITFGGDTYLTGLGYSRSAIEDKFDMSVDNMEITGVLDTTYIDRDAVRAGLFDRAQVRITIVNWKTLSQGGLIKRSGRFGEVKQNNNGEFSVELRGLTQALSETLVESYTPGCRVDIGSAKCGIPLSPTAFLRQNSTDYPQGRHVTISGVTSVVFKSTRRGVTATSIAYDPAPFSTASVGDTVTDGTMVWEAVRPFYTTFVVTSVTSRRAFTIDIVDSAGRWDEDAAYFDGGQVLFSTGENAGLAQEISLFDFDTSNGGAVSLYLRMPFVVTVGDTGSLYPGCFKGIDQCSRRFANAPNFRGFPHVPGDKYLKNYPNSK